MILSKKNLFFAARHLVILFGNITGPSQYEFALALRACAEPIPLCSLDILHILTNK